MSSLCKGTFEGSIYYYGELTETEQRFGCPHCNSQGYDTFLGLRRHVNRMHPTEASVSSTKAPSARRNRMAATPNSNTRISSVTDTTDSTTMSLLCKGVLEREWYYYGGLMESGQRFLGCPHCDQQGYDTFDPLRKHVSKKHPNQEQVSNTKEPSNRSKRDIAKYPLTRKEVRDIARKGVATDVATEMRCDTMEDCRKYGVYKKKPSVKHHLVYGTSTMADAGMGVFANKAISKSEIITWYDGNFCSNNPLPETDLSYTMRVSGGFLHGLKNPVPGRGLGSLINRGNEKFQINCQHQLESNGKTVVCVATKAIPKGQEVFSRYGTQGLRMVKVRK